MKKQIALVAGGYTGEYEISVKTAATIQANIDPHQYTVHLILIDRNEWTYLSPSGEKQPVNRENFTIQVQGSALHFDAVFIAMHGTPGEDGKFQGYLDMLQIPYTSCDAIVSGLTFNKVFCNRVVAQGSFVHVARSLSILHNQPEKEQEILNNLHLPVFVKPAQGGSSLATSKVNTPEELPKALAAVFDFDEQAIVEEYVPGREFSIGVYRHQGQLVALPPTEIISSKEFFDYEAKYTPGVSREITPAPIPEALTQEIRETACRIYQWLNCRGICRVDFILEEATQKLYFLEINTIPGQSEQSIVPQQVLASGQDLKSFYGQLIEETLSTTVHD